MRASWRFAVGDWQLRSCAFRPYVMLVSTFTFSLFHLSTFSQDIHFSQFFNTPLATGPGSIGMFDGDYRASGVFRQQWRSVTHPSRSLGLGGDAKNFLGMEGLGAGVWLYNDRAGDSRLKTFHLSIGGSWTERLGGSDEHALTGGLQLGFTSLSLDRSALSFDSQYNGFYYDPGSDNGENFGRDAMVHADLHAGLVYRYNPAPREVIQVGLGLFNLTTPDIGFLDEPGVPLDMRAAFHVITQFPVSERVDILPMLNYMAQGRFRELDLGGAVRLIQMEKFGLRRAVRLGAYYRAADAGYLYAGVEYDAWDVGISYDINFSDLVPASRHRGAIEFTAIYILRKTPLLPRYKACPALM